MLVAFGHQQGRHTGGQAGPPSLLASPPEECIPLRRTGRERGDWRDEASCSPSVDAAASTLSAHERD
jgi:hypothetical protein